jgi:hypothetical protein
MDSIFGLLYITKPIIMIDQFSASDDIPTNTLFSRSLNRFKKILGN